MRKYEIDLPLSYCDGEPIEQEKIKSIHDELLAVFGSFVVPDRKTWKYDGVRYVEIMKVEVVTTEKIAKKRLTDLRKRLEEFLQQSDILITNHVVQVI